MEFYRKPEQRSRLVTPLKKMVLRNKKRSLLALIGSLLLLYVLFANNGILARIKLERERTELIEKVRQAEEETKKLQEHANALKSDKRSIEKVAREKHGMVRKGETVYRVKKD